MGLGKKDKLEKRIEGKMWLMFQEGQLLKAEGKVVKPSEHGFLLESIVQPGTSHSWARCGISQSHWYHF